jgi:hypothetical protein
MPQPGDPLVWILLAVLAPLAVLFVSKLDEPGRPPSPPRWDKDRRR